MDPAGRGPATQPTVSPSMMIGWRSIAASADSAPACRSRMIAPSRSVIVRRASVPATPQPQDLASAAQQLVRVERLGHIQVRAGRQTLLAVVGLALGSQQDHIRVGQAQILLDD